MMNDVDATSLISMKAIHEIQERFSIMMPNGGRREDRLAIYGRERKLTYRDDPRDRFNTLSVKRAEPKRLPGESARQAKKRIKQERREAKE